MRSLRTAYVRSRPVREEWVEDVLFLIDQREQAIHALEPIGAGIWSMLAEPASIAETKKVLCQAFPRISPRRIERDVKRIFAEFEESGLIRNAR